MYFKNLKEERFIKSKYIKPKRYSYESNGKNYTWDFIEAMDSVSVLIYHQDKKSFIFVKQFRIPLWDYQKRNKINLQDMGFSIELCSGLVDKNLSLEDIAIEECIEEVGYKPKIIEKIDEFYTGFGSGVSMQHLFYAIVDDSCKLNEGGGIDGENIELVWIEKDEFEQFSKNNLIKTPLLEYAYLWFKNNTNY